jgi:hypothetical protein
MVNANPGDFTVESTRIFFRSEELSSIKKAFSSSCPEPSSHTLLYVFQI